MTNFEELARNAGWAPSDAGLWCKDTTGQSASSAEVACLIEGIHPNQAEEMEKAWELTNRLGYSKPAR